ncbi:UTP--glucose-1-phosphate uridylyltransferase [Lyngbya sp. CCY1209]|uniref:UTP--glucose-1-phosphate uridylyltransferase n=1 Tax=Lyngbya sp. CCY1209 TaxID=2886103 RepID=UPI002D217B47|nr:UTP--glucose-1-phosphate uridylyltransferase [Lyngbya sp. CCY1209]MEB3885018.1 UTP--glucose-1-phosphate uridylyltransferase [Lyngbya sp. CCY1209]
MKGQENRRVRKAVIPAAGFGTRMFPASKMVKKEFFPIVDSEGVAKPVIQVVVEEALHAGIEEVGIVVQAGDRELFEDFFQGSPKPELWRKLSPDSRDYSHYLQTLGERITILTQEQQEGFGHAVFCAAQWVNEEPFLLLLGDHVYASDLKVNCARQLMEVYEEVQQNIIGLRMTPGDRIRHYGCVAGKPVEETENLFDLTQIYEKPTLDYARTNLRVRGLDWDRFLTVFGLYILDPKIFNLLADNIRHDVREKGEYQLTSCLETLREQDEMKGYIIRGRSFDTGLPETYFQTLVEFKSINN